ncbi:TetR/AcrR family transcriptional regulator [Halobacillus litoralis]|uniref:TetR/AcrR family transcriptional regulator n=1 Tax=Halobacillus litoralis TaxID=45668 RepID=UPI001CD424FD|nr:TetR/AcrR family transcriptional regulator [Halobacillus litoralis]MCA0972480.1 TetR/AcrR family transcriptional regulator [Halobacillus litoralis]
MSITSVQIKQISLKNFAQNGYEGASMAEIADEVGIKKQSIYTHFKGKDELFLTLCQDAYEHEIAFLMNYVKQEKELHLEDFLYNLLVKSKDRYETDDSTKFWIRTAFYPPVHLTDQIMQLTYEYLDRSEELLLPVIASAQDKQEVTDEVEKKEAASAYLALLDSLYVDMLYGGPRRVERRLEASWNIYWRGISHQSK